MPSEGAGFSCPKEPPVTSVAYERARVASLSRSRTHDDPDLTTARTNLAAATLEARIKRLVDAAPSLSTEQRERLVAILQSP
jgi:hypothetical protein